MFHRINTLPCLLSISATTSLPPSNPWNECTPLWQEFFVSFYSLFLLQVDKTVSGHKVLSKYLFNEWMMLVTPPYPITVAQYCNLENNNRASKYVNCKSFYDAQCGPSEVCAKLWSSKSFTPEQTHIQGTAREQAATATPCDNKRQQHQWASEIPVLFLFY